MRTYTIIIIVDTKAKTGKVEYSNEGALLITVTSEEQGFGIGNLIENQMAFFSVILEHMETEKKKPVKAEKVLDKGV
jgi:hypothetical protein